MRAVYTTLAALAVAAGLSAQPRVQSINNDWSFALGSAEGMYEDFTHGTEYFTYIAKARSADHNGGPVMPAFEHALRCIEAVVQADKTFPVGVKPVHRRVNGVEGVMVAPLLVFCAVVYGGTFDFNLSCGEIPLEILHSVTALPEVQRSLAGLPGRRPDPPAVLEIKEKKSLFPR